MQTHYLFLALDIARERAAEADAQRLAHLGHPGVSAAQRVRRAIARIALAVARAADRDTGTVSLRTQ